MSTPQELAADRSAQTNSALRNGNDAGEGRQAALSLLEDSLKKDREPFGEHDKNGYFQYFKSLTEELQSKGTLPALSLEWSKRNAAKFDLDGKGGLTIAELELALRDDNVGAFERMMLEGLKQNYEPLRNSHKDGKEDGITSKDVESSLKKLNTADRMRREDEWIQEEQKKVKNLTQRLLKVENGRSLFTDLDIANGGTADNKVSFEDLRTFLRRYEGDPRKGREPLRGGAYTAENYQLVKDMFDSYLTDDGKYSAEMSRMLGGRHVRVGEELVWSEPNQVNLNISTIASAIGVADADKIKNEGQLRRAL